MKYRLVYFTPDPFSGSRFAIGALVGNEQAASFTRADHIPGPACVGGPAAWLSLQKSLESLSSLERLEADRGFASQLISMSELSNVPRACPDPVAWVRRSLLPVEARQPTQTSRVRGLNRSSWGRRFFEHWSVSRFVKSRFSLDKHVSVAEGLPTLSHKPTHYVLGRDEVLLMEPLVGTRASFASDLPQVSGCLLAQLKQFELARTRLVPQLVAYVFSNGYRGAMSEARREFGSFVEIVDVETEGPRAQFLERIQRLGRTEGTLFD